MTCDDVAEGHYNGINDELDTQRVKGVIVKRRSHGNHLAFADIQCETGEDSITVSVAFRVSSFSKTTTTTIFPNKKSALPYGAKVEMFLIESCRENGPRWEVVEWSLLEDPFAQAQEAATQKEGGILHTKYLQARGSVYLSLCDSHTAVKNLPLRRQKETVACIECASINHGRNKGLRAKIFAKWLFENMNISHEDCALDIAGGKGLLSMELAHTARIPCTVVDPLIRKKLNTKHLEKLNAPIPQFVTEPFYNNEETRTSTIVASSTLLVGLHPDECTEDILDVALTCGKSVAIVPCCVFPSLFPLRRFKDGRTVTSYSEFLDYLLEKDPRLHQAELPVEGKNQVIYLKV